MWLSIPFDMASIMMQLSDQFMSNKPKFILFNILPYGLYFILEFLWLYVVDAFIGQKYSHKQQ